MLQPTSPRPRPLSRQALSILEVMLDIFAKLLHALAMRSVPFESPRAAYQLHYYVCLRTKRNESVFNQSIRASLEKYLNDICNHCGFRLLERRSYENQLRLVLSLRPEHSVAESVKKIRGNLSRSLCATYSELEGRRVWSRGYFAKSIGKVEEAVIAKYITNQAQHHGYEGNSASLVCEYDEPKAPASLSYRNHVAFNLTHHLVLDTQSHIQVFDDVTGNSLILYWLRVAQKKRFQIAQIRVLPNHCHLRVRLVPAMSVIECVRALMNNSWAMMNRRFWGVLKQTDAWHVWEPSFYAGTIGDVTTAEVKAYLRLAG
jgi:REP-associated tyrosine transposase